MYQRIFSNIFFPIVLTYIFSPQLGYLLAIPRSPEMKEEDDFAMDGLEFVVRWLFIDKAYIQWNPVLGGQPHNCNITVLVYQLFIPTDFIQNTMTYLFCKDQCNVKYV